MSVVKVVIDFENEIRKLYWENLEKNEKNSFHDVLYEFTRTLPTEEQVKEAFFKMPFSDICDGMKFGLSDTEVRGNIYTYFQNNPLQYLP